MKYLGKTLCLLCVTIAPPSRAEILEKKQIDLRSFEISTATTLLSCDLVTWRRTSEARSFLVELNKPTKFGPMHCVYDLTIDMTPCSVDGEWSLSYPTGDASIASSAPSMSSAYEHMGGKFHSYLGPLEFKATAIFGEGFDAEISMDKFDFDLFIDRRTGKGDLIQYGTEGTNIECQYIDRMF